MIFVFTVTDLLLILGAAARNELRWAKQHLYFLLVLGPIVVGFAVITLERAAAEIPPFQPGQYSFFAGAVVFYLALIAAGLSSTAAAIYHVRQPESIFESFPIAPTAHLSQAIVFRFVRAGAIVLAILLARWRWLGSPISGRVLFCGLLLTLIISLTEVVCSLAWVHWNHLQHIRAALVGLVVVLTSAGIAADLMGKLFVPDRFAVHRLNLFTAIMFVWVLLLLFAVWRMHDRWRVRDIEFASRLRHRRARNWTAFSPVLARMGMAVRSLLTRDLALVRRVFSSAVYVSSALILLIIVLLVTVLWSGTLPNIENPYGWIGGGWLAPVMAVKAACVIGCLSVAALLPVMVAYQLPHLWLERSVGAQDEDMWKAKLYLTRCITLPVSLLVWLVGTASGAVPANYVFPLLLECIWLWWMVSTVIGSLAFEIPDRPGLALVLMILIGFGSGMFIAWLWPVGIVVYVMGGIRTLRDRGISRAGYCLVFGES